MLLWILLLTLAGGILIFAEIYLPGMILGILGGLALIAASALAFAEFGLAGGTLFAVCIFLGVLVGIALALQWFPKSPAGRRLTLQSSLTGASSHSDHSELTGAEGKALTPLRPSGTALLGGRRTDVVAESGFIDSGSPIRVISVEGSKIIVRQLA